MALPKQVQAQLDEAEAIEKQLNGEQPPAAPVEEPAAPTPPKAENQETPPAPAPEPVPVKVDTPPAPSDTDSDEKWQQRYRTLKGMYDAEVPRLHQQVKTLTGDLATLRTQLSEALEKVNAPPAAPVSSGPLKSVTDEEVREFGPALIDIQRRIAEEVSAGFRKDLDELRTENKHLREQLTSTDTKIEVSAFDTKLRILVPDFDTLNTNPKWVEWLGEFDPMLRGPRRVAVQAAYDNGDADALAHYVSLFRSATTPAPTPTPAPAPSTADELALQIQPPKNASQPTATAQGKTYTNKQIGDMFEKAAKLSARGDLDAARRLEAEIDAAYADGRVTA